MSSRQHRITFSKLVNEPWFIDASHRLRDLDNAAAYTITDVEEAWLERRVGAKQRARVDGIQLSALGIYRDGTMVGGLLNKDPDADPPAGNDYYLLVPVAIKASEEYGGDEAGIVLEVDVTIAANWKTAPALTATE